MARVIVTPDDKPYVVLLSERVVHCDRALLERVAEAVDDAERLGTQRDIVRLLEAAAK